jgi:hypothetical protein
MGKIISGIEIIDSVRVTTILENLENLENSGNWKCLRENLENSGNFMKRWKTQEIC